MSTTSKPIWSKWVLSTRMLLPPSSPAPWRPVSRQLERVEIVEDRTSASRCDEGFLRVRRLVLRNVYADGSTSRDYDCDIVSRRHVDAVAVVIYERGGSDRVRVALREGLLFALMGRMTDRDARERTVDSMARRFHVDRSETRGRQSTGCCHGV